MRWQYTVGWDGNQTDVEQAVISGYRKKSPPNENPEAREFALRGLSLRDRLHTSNYILVKIPIEIHNIGHGERLTCLDSDRLPLELGLNDQDIDSLSQRGLVRRRLLKPRTIEQVT